METTKLHQNPFADLPGVTVEDHIEAKTEEIKYSWLYYAIRILGAVGFLLCYFLSFHYLRQLIYTGDGSLPLLSFAFCAIICLTFFLVTTEDTNGTFTTPEQYILRFSRNVPATTIAFLSKNYVLEPIDDTCVFWRVTPKQ